MAGVAKELTHVEDYVYYCEVLQLLSAYITKKVMYSDSSDIGNHAVTDMYLVFTRIR